MHRITRHLGLMVMVSFAIILLSSHKALAFCEDGASKGNFTWYCHKQIVERSLSFLRPTIKEAIADHVNDPDHHHYVGYKSDEHFDNCNFDGGTDLINDRYMGPWIAPPFPSGVVAALLPDGELKDYPVVFDTMATWARILHAAQDFYAHSNWIELGYTNRQADLVDAGFGPWREISANWNLVRDDVLASQGNLPSGWQWVLPGNIPNPPPFWMAYLFSDSNVPVVQTADGKRYRVLITGTEWNPQQRCPWGAAVGHDSLNKDNGARPNHFIAGTMASLQTRHEWCRLLHLMWDAGGAPAAAVPLGLLVQPGGNPHPEETGCAALPAGPTQVTVTVSGVKVLHDKEDDGPGQLNFVLTMFTSDFRRSVRAQTDELSVSAGEMVKGGDLPPPLTLCVNRSEKVVVTLQGWEDDESSQRRQLSNKDDLLSGVTYSLPSIESTSSLVRASDNPSRHDLDVTFSVRVLPQGVTKVCSAEKPVVGQCGQKNCGSHPPVSH